MKVYVRYFAHIAQTLGCKGETLQTDAQTLGELRDQLIAKGGPYEQALARSNAVRASLDQSMCSENALLHEGAEVALFPPVTGG